MKHFRLYPWRYLPKRLLTSFSAIVRLLYFKPLYTLLAAAVSIIFYEIIFWLLNIGLAQYLFTSPYISPLEKLSVLAGSYTGIFSTPLSPLALTLFAVSILQGITVASLMYTIRYQRREGRDVLKNIGGAGIAGLFSALGLGCAACGTSLVTPLLTFFFATSSVALADTVGFYSTLVALVAAIVTTYLSGYKLAACYQTPVTRGNMTTTQVIKKPGQEE